MAYADGTDHYYLISNTRNRVARSFYRDKPNWVLVMDMFGVGSTMAIGYCRDSGIDPDATTVGQRPAKEI